MVDNWKEVLARPLQRPDKLNANGGGAEGSTLSPDMLRVSSRSRSPAATLF